MPPSQACPQGWLRRTRHHLGTLCPGSSLPAAALVAQLRASALAEAGEVTSLYLDTPQLDAYAERLKKAEGAAVVRLRWYGPVSPGAQAWLERKTHHEPWTGERSLKARPALPAALAAALGSAAAACSGCPAAANLCTLLAHSTSSCAPWARSDLLLAQERCALQPGQLPEFMQGAPVHLQDRPKPEQRFLSDMQALIRGWGQVPPRPAAHSQAHVLRQHGHCPPSVAAVAASAPATEQACRPRSVGALPAGSKRFAGPQGCAVRPAESGACAGACAEDNLQPHSLPGAGHVCRARLAGRKRGLWATHLPVRPARLWVGQPLRAATSAWWHALRMQAARVGRCEVPKPSC